MDQVEEAELHDFTTTAIFSSLKSIALAVHHNIRTQHEIDIASSIIRKSLLKVEGLLTDRNKSRWKATDLDGRFLEFFNADRHYKFQINVKRMPNVKRSPILEQL